MRIIDSHNHFWKYNSSEFGWIDDKLKRIRLDFLPEDLKRELKKTIVVGVVSVQARQRLVETDWLLNICKRNDFILGILGWFPLADSSIEAYLEQDRKSVV